MKIGFNGRVVDANEAVIPVFDHGFLYGMGLFETFRTYSGVPYLLDRHLERLHAGCEQLGIVVPVWLDSAMAGWIEAVRTANGLADAYIRLTLSAGSEELGLPAGPYERANAILMAKALPAPRSLEQGPPPGKQLRLLHTRRNTPEGEVRLKSLHYMNSILAKRELAATGAPPGTEGLMLTADGKLAEGIVSNLFFAAGGIIHTPAIATGILPGITRARIIELARTAGLEVREGFYTWEELCQADEAWVCNSIQELCPVGSLIRPDGAGISMARGHGAGVGLSVNKQGSGAGPITELLWHAYQRDIALACQPQH